ncbi:MAG TPA: sensor histidine kinase KdpD [Spirochaetia bacterium]|nr:sensor histidine kinase KdpD [Spirochaetia bacterium]
MSDDFRPDPDALLRAIEREREGKGKLKVFFGMAAGVGKTYTMLKEARQKQTEGVDVVIGYLESHQRKDTEELATVFETIPRRAVEYRGRTLEEMDLDAVIARRPALVLVDELAHTNVPGVRNEKRYQDVLELIAMGIDVFTTVNVQHLESFADTVEEIAGIAIHERIPDSVFDAADQVVLIDISPEELLKRLAEGKVYLGDSALSAMENFFKKSTLTALREMSLRYTALLVDHQLASFAKESGRESPAKSGDRLLVAISPSPNSAHLIRWTRQRAFSLKAEWTALFIETGQPLSEAAQESLRKNMNLARQLGAAVVSIPSEDVAETVLRYARSNNVSQIVLGKSGLSTHAGPFARRSVTDRILAGSRDIDVAVVQEKGTTVLHSPTRLATAAKSQAGRFAVSLALVAAITGINLLALPEVGYHTVSILYLLCVIAIAFFATRTEVLVCAALSALLWDYFFIPPRFTLAIGKLEDALMIILYFVTAAALAFPMSRLRVNQKMLAVRERRVTLLYSFSQSLSILHSIPEIVQASLDRISKYFDAECILFLRDSETTIERSVRSLAAVQIDEKEFGVAQWCFANRTPCGKYTDTLAFASFHYIPLLTPDSTIGVMGIRMPEGRAWPHDQDQFLQTLGRNLSLSIEREFLAEENRKNLMARESERLGRALLNSISHELRTPLTTIKGCVSALMDPATVEDRDARSALLAETLTATDRLNSIVENLLSMSRLESGMLRLKKSSNDIFDLVSVVADAMRRQSHDHPLSIRIDEDVPQVSLDFILMTQVLTNILVNTARHTPPGTPVEISVERKGRGVRITVADAGPGVLPEELPHLFDRFFRGRKAASGGVGLGLSISKGIVEAHGGKITAYLNRKGGLSVSIFLPDSIVEGEISEESARQAEEQAAT